MWHGTSFAVFVLGCTADQVRDSRESGTTEVDADTDADADADSDSDSDSDSDTDADVDTDTGTSTACPDFVPGEDPIFAPLLEAMAVLVDAADGSHPSGLSIAIVKDGELLSAGGVGTRAKAGHPGAGEPVDRDTLFWIASTSKWVNGVALSSLVEEGALDLHAPVTELLPDYTETNGRQDAITLHDLMRMKSGLANDGGCWVYSVSASEEPDGCAQFVGGPETVLAKMFDPAVLVSSPYDGSLGVYNITSQGEPGTAGWYYSNWGAMLSGRLAEIADGRAYEQLVAARVFAPAEMCTATYDPSVVVDSENYAIGENADAIDGYCLEPELGHDSRAPFFPDELACPGRNPNGGVRASAVDMGRFAEALLADLYGEGRVLSASTANQMLCPDGGTWSGGDCQRPGTGGSQYGDSYGYFNFHQTTRGYDTYTHGGGRAGYGSLFWIIPSERFAIAILGNDGGVVNDMESVADVIVGCYLDGDC